jgi:hypothetical protein
VYSSHFLRGVSFSLANSATSPLYSSTSPSQKMHDDSLGQVVNVKSSTGRATTPQLKRHNVTTPQRNGSAGRSGSAGRTQSSQAAAAAVTTASSGRKRSHLSKRTRQRWENDHLFGLQVFLSKLQIGGDENSKKKNKHEEDEAWNEGLMDINWTSLFHEILLPENSEALKAYLACASSFTQTNSSSPHQMKTFQDCVTEWERAEYSWNNVEKRLRKVIQTAIVNQIEARNFILMIEDILLEMDAYLDRLIEQQEQQTEKEGQQSNALISFVYSIPDDMEHHFARPIRVKYPSKQQQLPVLQITLRDSAYHRLLLHATCQFHGRNSKVPPLPLLLDASVLCSSSP